MSDDNKRDLNADLAVCASATEGPWNVGRKSPNGLNNVGYRGLMIGQVFEDADARFIAEACTGWPHAIERAIAAEAESERLREIIALLRCAECGDELGDNWTEVDGEVLCEYCVADDDDED